MKRSVTGLLCAPLLLLGCGGSDARDDAAFQTQVTTDMRSYLLGYVDSWKAASVSLQQAAPTPADRGWDANLDAAAIQSMRQAWLAARDAYEHIEGVVAPFFPDRDVATDARYDDFLATLGPAGDPNLFDDSGVTGMHGIERILFADRIPADVVRFESGLGGYRPASFPVTSQEAADFKNLLTGKLVSDVGGLRTELSQIKFDIAAAFNGVVDLVGEQKEKVDKTATGEEESRYAQTTMRDLRSNFEGCRDFFRLFAAWLDAKGAAGMQARAGGEAGFERLKTSYDAVTGDAIPTPPPTWNDLAPSADDLATPFGKLWHDVHLEADEGMPDRLAAQLSSALQVLGYQRQP